MQVLYFSRFATLCTCYPMTPNIISQAPRMQVLYSIYIHTKKVFLKKIWIKY